jgi:hypothetical protein
VSLVKAPEVLRLAARQQILIGELIADHVGADHLTSAAGARPVPSCVLLVGDE